MKLQRTNAILVVASLAVGGIAGSFLTGCGASNATMNQSGNALALSAAEIERQFNVGLAARTAPGDQTIADFLASQGVTALTPAEADFIRNTMTEHNETIVELQEFGSEGDE